MDELMQPRDGHQFIPELTLIAVIAKKPVVMVATRWFCVSTSIHTCLHCLDPADKELSDLVS